MKRQQQQQQHQHNMPSSNSASGSKSRFDSGGLSKSHHHNKYGKGSSSHELDYDLREIIDDEDGDMLMGDDHHCMGDDTPPGSSNLLDVCIGLFVIYRISFCVEALVFLGLFIYCSQLFKCMLIIASNFAEQ